MLPTGLTYSSLAKRFMPSIANGTCGVGRRVFRSSCKRVARCDAGCGSGPTTGRLPRSVSCPVPDSLPRERCRAAIPCSGGSGSAAATDDVEPKIDGATLCSSSSALESKFFTVDFLSSKFRGVAVTGPGTGHCDASVGEHEGLTVLPPSKKWSAPFVNLNDFCVRLGIVHWEHPRLGAQLSVAAERQICSEL